MYRLSAAPASALVVLALLTGGCSWLSDDEGVFVDKSDDYLEATQNEPLKIPEGLDTARVQDPFPIPEITDRLRPEYYPNRPPRPDTIYATDNRDEVRIQRLGDRRWLVVPEPPTTVWPKVKQFLAENGIPLAWEAPGEGRLDTEWLDVGAQSYRDVVRQAISEGKQVAGLAGGEDRLRLRVEPGLRERATEIHIRHENTEFSAPSGNRLVELRDMASHVPEIEQEVLTEVGAYIAARVAEQTVSMVAQDIGAGVKSSLAIDADGDPVLELRLDRERAWATVGQALSRAEVDVLDADEQAGVYHVSLPEDLEVEADEPGFFGRLFSFGGRDMLDVRLKLEQTGERTHALSALNEEGQPLDRELGQQVLVLIREYAS